MGFTKYLSGLNLKKNISSIGGLLIKLRTFIALIVLLIFFSITADNFLEINNLIIMTKHVSITAFLAIGMTFVIISGGIDLSVGAIVGLTGMIAGGLIFEGLVIPLPMFGVEATFYFNILIVILIGLLVGILVGFVNGIVITRFKVAPFIATLGTLHVARGLANIRSNGGTFPRLYGDPALGTDGFLALGTGNVLGIPIPIWIMLIIFAIAVYISKKTPLGRHIYAVGGNEEAAKLSGIRVKRVRMFVYIFAGFCSAIAGLIWASQLGAATPKVGEGFELDAIAAAVLGGTSLSGGIGTIGGTLVGAFVIGVLGDGMVMIGVSPFLQQVIKGTVIVLAVIIDTFQRNMQQKSTLR
ncbi:MAG: ABC transporter permease [Spirochaetales bacterium]|nr:ABC transporter permease [Spirochaetales bacterium]